MIFFAEHPRARWAVPAAAVAVVAATGLATTRTASADAGLQPRTAAQLLVDLQKADLESLSGTVVQTSDLGLPQIPGLTGGAPGGGAGGDTSLTSALSGTHTWRVWFAGPQKTRLALVGSLGESDVIHNGGDVWLWSSADKTAVHTTLPADLATGKPGSGKPGLGKPGATGETPSLAPTDLPKTPDEAAAMALAALDPTTSVTTSGTAVVAGRQAYELVLRPKDAATRVAQVRIAVDSEKRIPLRVQVYSTKLANPAIEVGFSAVDFATPDARQFAFNPPAGTTVTESSAVTGSQAPGAKSPANAAPPTGAVKPKVVGTGWSSVVVATLPPQDSSSTQQNQLQGMLQVLPKTSGAWGSGRVVDGTLFSAVLTDDGRVAVGAVAPEVLYAALAAK